ncbi:unnamed protein product [Ceratitis capitata]|uniref:(Mediterranean fruit fly) hypothetical protein n=1 Tax=Ceratitis capitata TaxID=7213 RepID=A0A811VJ22_CERCA|nr:unnamed protein product [Ceratitis capitata]
MALANRSSKIRMLAREIYTANLIFSCTYILCMCIKEKFQAQAGGQVNRRTGEQQANRRSSNQAIQQPYQHIPPSSPSKNSV